jgi:hypothetical protein
MATIRRYALQSITAIILSTGLCAVKVGNGLVVRLSRHSGGHNQRVARKASSGSLALNLGTFFPAGASFSRARSLVARSASRQTRVVPPEKRHRIMRSGSVGTCLKCFDQSGFWACVACPLRIIRY